MNLRHRFTDFARRVKAVAPMAAATAMLSAPGLALATTSSAEDLGDAASAELATAKTIIKGLLIVLVGIVFLFVVYSLIKRAK